jgi:hypothetical protein
MGMIFWKGSTEAGISVTTAFITKQSLKERFTTVSEPCQCSQYDWLWPGRPRGQSSSPGTVNYFHLSISSRPAPRSAQPPTQRVPGALSLGVKRLEHEADHSPPSSAEVKKMCTCTSTPPCVFLAQCLVKHRDSFVEVMRQQSSAQSACNLCDRTV